MISGRYLVFRRRRDTFFVVREEFMHIPENYLSPSVCAVMTAAMIPVWVHAERKVIKELPKEKLPLIGVGAAFSFLGMMFNVPLPGGTTGHAVGGTLIALLFGPDAACIAVSVALLIQAVLFGDGGILAFGANCFNMAFVLPYTGYAVYRLIRKQGSGTRREMASAAVGAYVGLNAAALCAAVEFGLQPMLFRDALGNALYCPYDLSVSIPAMMIPHLTVAGIVEALFTVAIYSFVRKTSPGLITGALAGLPEMGGAKEKGKRYFPAFALIAVMIAAVPLGLLAAGTAWGEWGAEEIAGIVTRGSELGYVPSGLANGWSFKAPLPDYTLGGSEGALAYILSAVIGVALLIILFKLLSIPVRRREGSHAS